LLDKQITSSYFKSLGNPTYISMTLTKGKILDNHRSVLSFFVISIKKVKLDLLHSHKTCVHTNSAILLDLPNIPSNSWISYCIASFNMGWQDSGGGIKFTSILPTHVKTHNTKYFDCDMSNKRDIVEHLDEKVVIYIYVCGHGHTQFMQHRLALLLVT
jgi:hypothetical protein